jgi:hypothetical protein
MPKPVSIAADVLNPLNIKEEWRCLWPLPVLFG